MNPIPGSVVSYSSYFTPLTVTGLLKKGIDPTGQRKRNSGRSGVGGKTVAVVWLPLVKRK